MLLFILHAFVANCISLLQNSWWTADVKQFFSAACRLIDWQCRKGGRQVSATTWPAGAGQMRAQGAPRGGPRLSTPNKLRDLHSASQDTAREGVCWIPGIQAPCSRTCRWQAILGSISQTEGQRSTNLVQDGLQREQSATQTYTDQPLKATAVPCWWPCAGCPFKVQASAPSGLLPGFPAHDVHPVKPDLVGCSRR